MIYFLLAFLLVLIFSILITSLVKPPSLPIALLYIYLISFSEIVIVCEIAGLFNQLSNRLFILSIHFILTLFTFFLWKKLGKPQASYLFDKYLHYLKKDQIIASIRKYPIVWGLACVVITVYLFNAFIIIKVPPNNFDSMTSHMVRVAYWYQHGNLRLWPTWNWTQQFYPVNAQLQILWTVLFSGNDKFAGFPQWFSAISGIITVYGLTRFLGYKKPQSALAALIWALLPEILLESTTTQNHLIAGTLFAVGIFLLFFGIRHQTRRVLFFSALAIGLSVGTHQEIFFALPGLFIASLVLSISMKKGGLKCIFYWGGMAILMFLLFGSCKYLMNYANFGNPLFPSDNKYISDSLSQIGDPQKTASSEKFSITTSEKTISLSIVNNVSINTFRYFYASFDLSGFPKPISEKIYNLRTKVATKVFNALNIPMNSNSFELNWWPETVSEDTSWFGIAGFLLITPLLLSQGITGIKRKDYYRLGIIVIIFLFTIFMAGLYIGGRSWSVFQGRNFIFVSLLSIPFFAAIINDSKWTFRILCLIIILISIYQAIFITFNNRSKPLIGQNAVWNLDWKEKITLNAKQYLILVEHTEKYIPINETVGLVLPGGSFEYPLFGEKLSRELIPLYPDEMFYDHEYMDRYQINWIIICKKLDIPKNFSIIDSFKIDYYSRECSILSRKEI
jgi:hypothetical protein